MTVKEELRELIESLDEDAAAEALSFVRVLVAKQDGEDTEAILALAKPITADDPIWNIVGIGKSDGPTDIARNKHKYLAEAYADLHEE